jgi:hypothetical protein
LLDREEKHWGGTVRADTDTSEEKVKTGYGNNTDNFSKIVPRGGVGLKLLHSFCNFSSVKQQL